MVYSQGIMGWAIGPWEVVIILTIALLIFGKRLPEVGKSLGKGLVEFKKGLRGVEDEIDRASSSSSYDYDEPARLDSNRDKSHEESVDKVVGESDKTKKPEKEQV